MAASSCEFAVAQTLSEIASKREVPMTAIEETLGFPFSAPFRPPTELAATVVSLAVVIQGIRPECHVKLQRYFTSLLHRQTSGQDGVLQRAIFANGGQTCGGDRRYPFVRSQTVAACST